MATNPIRINSLYNNKPLLPSRMAFYVYRNDGLNNFFDIDDSLLYQAHIPTSYYFWSGRRHSHMDTFTYF
jgi:hypothetical protein